MVELIRSSLRLESAVSTISVLTAIALTTAFLYDAVFFAFLAPQFLNFLTLGDHIETAIASMPFLIPYWLAMTGIMALYPSFQRTRKIAIVILLAVLAVGGIAYLYFFEFDELMERWGISGLVAIFVIGQVVGGVCIYILRNSPDPDSSTSPYQGVPVLQDLPPFRMAVVSLLLWIAATIVLATGHAMDVATPFNLAASHRISRITMHDHSFITGRMARAVDKGIILVTPSSKSVQFVPRDQIRRVEVFRHDVPRSDI